MEYQLIATDLDGTLLNKKEKVSPENYQAMKQLRDLGVLVVPASGRSFEEMPEELKSCPQIRYYIGSDGSTIYDKQTGTTHQLAMPKEVGHVVLDKLFSYPVNMMIHAHNRSYVDESRHDESDYRRNNYSDSWVHFVFETNTPVKDFKAFTYGLDNIEMCCAFFERYEDLLECKEFFEQHPDLLVAQSNKYNLEIISKNAGKGKAMLHLADLLGIDRAATIAVGDSTNDLTMVRQAGLGLAMENAVEELKSAADAVICDNDAHAIRYILENYIQK